jgi:tetratricopeptide (TPR) repeat protein
MATWIAFPYDAADYALDVATLRTRWERLHRGDAEPLPDNDAVLAAWALFHGGQFQQAYDAGLQAGGAGITVANKAQAVHASYLETSERVRLAMLLEISERAGEQAQKSPDCAAAHYWLAYSLARYSHGTNIARAAAQGFGERVKTALETAIALSPRHADARVALGSFHAEVIDRVGRPLGTAQGADAAIALESFKEALALNPTSVPAHIEYAMGLVMLEGERRVKEAEQLCADAAACTAEDAAERLEVEMARAELHDI